MSSKMVFDIDLNRVFSNRASKSRSSILYTSYLGKDMHLLVIEWVQIFLPSSVQKFLGVAHGLYRVWDRIFSGIDHLWSQGS
jgi:hypothetical protein